MTDAVRRVAQEIDRLVAEHRRPLIAIDGPDAAGKTTFADALAATVTAPVCRASVDDFHRPARERMRRGPLSAEGCYHDSFDYDALVDGLLVPFASGAERVVTAVFDHHRDEPRERVTAVGEASALVLDGVFLLRPRLRPHWTLTIHLHVDEEVTLARALARDVATMGSQEIVRERYRVRYLPAQQLYRTEADPLSVAQIVIDNNDPARPRVVRWDVPTR